MNDSQKLVVELDSHPSSETFSECKKITGMIPPNEKEAVLDDADKCNKDETNTKTLLKVDETNAKIFPKADDNIETLSRTPNSVPGAKRLKASEVGDEGEIEIPEGWRRQVLQRQGGISAGKYDVYYFSPLGKRLRSRKEVERHCEMNNLPYDLKMFRFTRVPLTKDRSPRKYKSPSLLKCTKTPKMPKIIKPKTKISPAKLFNKDSVKKSPKLRLDKSKSPLKSPSGDGLMKKRKKAIWVPPKSPFNLFQESLFQNPWKLLTGTMIFNRATSGDESIGNSFLWDFFKCWPSPEVLLKSDWKQIAGFLAPLSNQEKVAKMILKFSEEFLRKKWTYPKELHGIGKYGNDSYRIFCINEWRKVKPADYLLTFYVDWLWDNCTILGLD